MLKKLISQTAIYGLSTIIGRVLNYLLVPLYTNVFLPSEYGVVTELYGYVGFLMVIFMYGMETAFFRYVRDQKHSANTVYSTALLSILSSSLIFVTAFILFAQPIANAIQYANNTEYIIWFALVLGFDALSAIPFAKLRYEDKAIRFALIKLVGIAINIGLNLFFIVICPQIVDNFPLIHTIYSPEVGVGYIFISNLVASAATLALLLPEFFHIKWKFSTQLWKIMLRYSLPLVVVGFAGIINEMLDRVLLKYLLPYDLKQNMHFVGIYGACYKLSILMTLFIQAFRYAAEPFFFAQAKQKNAPETYALVMKYFVIAGGLIFLGVMLFIDFFKHFVGSDYHEGLPIVPILLLANLFLGIYYNLAIWYKLTNKTLIGAYISMTGAFITLVLNILFIPTWGYMISAWATLICYVVMVSLSYMFGRKHYPIPYNLQVIAKYLVLAILLFFVDKFVDMWINNTFAVQKWGFKLFILAFYAFLFWRDEKYLAKKQ